MSQVKLKALVREISSLQSQVNSMQSPQLKWSTVEDGGNVTVREPVLDEFGNVAINSDGLQMYREVLQVGSQWDGSYANSSLTSGQLPPPRCTAPDMVAIPGGIVIKWDGEFTDSLFAPMNFSRVETHLSDQLGFDPSFSYTIVGTTSSPRASYVIVQALDPSVTYYARFVVRDEAGARGPSSAESWMNPLANADAATTQAAIEAAIRAEGIAMEAKQEAVAATGAAAEATVVAGEAQGAAEAAQGVAQGAADAAGAAQASADQANYAIGNVTITADAAKAAALAAQAEVDAATSAANAADAKAIQALSKADASLLAADGKTRVTWSRSDPSSDVVPLPNDMFFFKAAGHNEGDVWFYTGNSGAIERQYQYVNSYLTHGSGWITRPVEGSVIASMSAGKLTTGVMGVGQMIHVGDPNSTHVEIGSSAVQLFRPDEDGAMPDVPNISIGGASLDQVMITGPGGETLAGLADDGSVTGKSLTAGEATIQGMPVNEPNNPNDPSFRFARGIVGAYLITSDSPRSSGTTVMGIAEVGAQVETRRRYRAVFDGNIFSDKAGLVRVFMYWTTDGSTPTVVSPPANQRQLNMGLYYIPSIEAFVKAHIEGHFFAGNDLDGKTVRVFVAIQKLTGGGVARFYSDSGATPGYLYIEDIGNTLAGTWENGAMNTGEAVTSSGGTHVPPAGGVKTSTYTWTAAWNRTWNGSSVYDTNGDVRQGSWGGRNYRSEIGFPTGMFSTLNGASIKKLEIYLYFHHWYYNAGGKAYYGIHNHTYLENTFYKSGTQVESFNKPQGRWLVIPSGWYSNWENGIGKGISLEATGAANYGRAYGVGGGSRAPQFRATYTR